MAPSDYAHHFSSRNIPFGIASSKSHIAPQAATRIENNVIFLQDLVTSGILAEVQGLLPDCFTRTTLNEFAALPKAVHQAVRDVVQRAFDSGGVAAFPPRSVEAIDEVVTHLPVHIGDFTDFSCSLEHVKNAGRIIIDNPNPPPAFFNLPIGYQGRTSSILVSGGEIERPMGQYRKKATESEPQSIVFGPSKAIDYELEFAAIIGKPLPMRQRLNAPDVDDHIFGFVLLNDWSARDIQGFEMQPLGPLNGKNLGTTISPWVVTLDALKPYQVSAPQPIYPVPSYLRDPENATFAVNLQVEVLVGDSETITGLAKLESLYWTCRQMIAHVASAGSALRTGDIMATGTVSEVGEEHLGSLLEVTSGGVNPKILSNGAQRHFLEDGDTVRMTAWAGSATSGVGFGDCVGKLIPSRPFVDA